MREALYKYIYNINPTISIINNRYVYVHIFNVCVYATRAFVGLERVLNRKERYMLEEYILVKIYLSSTEVLFQKMH